MSIYTLQNFYKDALTIATGTGVGNIYVTTAPTPSTGLLVINPSSATKREIVRYSATGSDSNGNFVTISNAIDRGVGGTTAQAHSIGEAVRMNYTAQHQADIGDAINQVASDLSSSVIAGSPMASETSIGVSRLTHSPNKTIGTATITIASPAVITSTAHGLTNNDRVQFSTTNTLPTGITSGVDYYVIATGLTTDDFEISATIGGSAIDTSGSQAGVHTLIRTTAYVVEDNDPRLGEPLTSDEKDAMAGGGDFGTPGSDNKFITETYIGALSPMPTLQSFTGQTKIGASSTQFDITDSGSNIYRYTFDGTGTDPSFSSANFPVGTIIDFQAENFSSDNKGIFVVVASGTNYIEVYNASGVAENNKTIGKGYIVKGAIYNIPENVVSVEVIMAGAGGTGGSVYGSGAGGAGGPGSLIKRYSASDLYTALGDSTTQYDITNITGNTYRYTYDGTGTDPSITAVTLPIGYSVRINGENFNTNNNGTFVITGVGANYFEITNVSGVVESNKTLGTGYLRNISTIYSVGKNPGNTPAHYAGGDGGGRTVFKSLIANGGGGGVAGGSGGGGSGGSASGGDINLTGGGGGNGSYDGATYFRGMYGISKLLNIAGGMGGDFGEDGLIVLNEYYSF
jgi:hypothetical protein